MQTIDNFNFKGKKAIVRVDFNVPLDKKTFEVTDDTRIRGALSTIKKILKDGGSAILMSHLGRPDGVPQDKYSLKHVLPALQKLLGMPVKYCCLKTSGFISKRKESQNFPKPLPMKKRKWPKML
jgi:phosphoglycerate kinase